MPTGAGAASVGFSIAGYGGVDSAPVQQQTILIDPYTNIAQNARRIDQIKGQYVLNQFGQVAGMSGVQQLVLMRAATLLDSSAVPNLGLSLPSGSVGPNTTAALTQQIMNAMGDLISQGMIQVVRVLIAKDAGSQAYHRYFTWRDLTATGQNAGIEQKTSF